MTKEKQKSKFEIMFSEYPVWRILIKLALPSIVMMLVMGSYFFFDNVLSINFAGHVYDSPAYKVPGLSGSTLVRIFMNGFSPINSLMVALGLLFGTGIAIRSSINLGKGDRDRAQKTIRTGFLFGMVTAIIITPILIVTAKAWIESQYKSLDARSVKIIGDTAFKFAWPVILSFPMMMFNNIIPSLLRNEARMKQMMFALIFPIFVNLLFDWVFMGPVGMGVEGGAWATFGSNTLTSVILIFFIFKSKKSSLLKWKILIGKDVKFLAIFGIIFIGISPFLRNIAQSITSTVQTNIINDVSGKIFIDDYLKFWNGLNSTDIRTLLTDPNSGFLTLIQKQSPKEWQQLITGLGLKSDAKLPDVANQIISLIPKGHNWLQNWNPPASGPSLVAYNLIHNIIKSQSSSTMISIMSGAMPVFILFFPTMFAFVQAASPIASYNYGAKNFHRVRQVYWWSIIYASIAGVIIYFLVSWGISSSLIELLKIGNVSLLGKTIINTSAISEDVLKIIMLSMIAYVFGIAAMVIFSSTDRVLFSIIASSLQGLILIWVVIYPFRLLAIDNPHDQLLFFWYLPVLTALASIVSTMMVIRTLFTINKKHQVTLDERVDFFYELQNFHRARITAIRKARKNGNLEEVKNEWRLKRQVNKKAKHDARIKAQKEVDAAYAIYRENKVKLKAKK